MFIILLVLSSKVFATDQWRVFGPGYVEKSQDSLPPFCKWHKTNISYNIVSAPSGLGYLIDNSFGTWQNSGYLSFSSGNDITIETLSGSHAWFGYGPFTHDSKGKITSAIIQLNGGTYPFGGDNKIIVWTDGNENVYVQADTFFVDVQNCVTHELGHNLGIAHHSTGNGEPTMAKRSQCPSFNTTLKRRTLETDDWLALDFLYKKAYVPKEYITISEAFALGIEGLIVYVESDIIHYFNSNLIVNSNETLHIKAGVIMKFQSSKKLQVYGTLIAEGTSGNHITFTRSGTSGTWYGINFENSSSDANCIVEYSDISQASNGIRCNYASPRIRNNKISNCSNGLYLYNSSPEILLNEIISNVMGIYGDNWNSSIVNDNAINDNASKGMRLINSSSPILYHTSIKRNGGNGVVASSASAPEFGAASSTEKGRNVIRDHRLAGIRAYGSSDVFLGSDNIGGQERGGYNAVYDNDQYNISVGSTTHIIAENNYWVDTLKFKIGAGSSLDFKPYLDYNPYGGSSLGKVQQNVSIDLISLDTNSVIGLDNLARKLWFEGNFLDAIEAYKKLIRKFPDSLQAKHALVRVMSLYKKTEGGWLSGYLESLTENQVSRELSDLALSLLIITYTNEMEFDRAISTTDQVLSNSPSAAREYETLFNLFNICFTGLSDTVKAAEVLGVLKDRYPDYELTLIAQEDMGEEVDWSLAKDLIDENIPLNKTMQLPTDYALEPNYPNPFNPTTTIRFALPEAGEVSLVVYDLMGREVVRLVDGHLEAGWRKVVWDGMTANGREVPTGIYIARLVTPDFTKAIKMVLLK